MSEEGFFNIGTIIMSVILTLMIISPLIPLGMKPTYRFEQNIDRKRANKIIKGKFEEFNSEKWKKLISKNNRLFYENVDDIAYTLAKVIKKKVYLKQYEIEKINKRIRNLNELIDKEFEGEVEIKAIEEEIIEFQKEISDGELFIEHNKKVIKELKINSKFHYKEYVLNKDEKLCEIKIKAKELEPWIYEYIKIIEKYKKIPFLSSDTKWEINKQLHAIVYFYLDKEDRRETLQDKEIKDRKEKIRSYARR